ncbi:MAG: hypothetical protein QOJ64_2092 [Acidobacteriota bacterium]|jgi:hypothetical protein|nr:hypothetical protein [Acidobacteriota bacterium]
MLKNLKLPSIAFLSWVVVVILNLGQNTNRSDFLFD